ncbi:MAG: GntR family transcriptional regulator [Planctomycetota bacterium]
MSQAAATITLIPDLNRGYTNRAAAAELRELLVGYLQDADLPVGTGLPTDAQIVEQTNLSRSTVRRALDSLQREGWIERFPGRGTFVGPRAATGLPSSVAGSPQIQSTDAVRDSIKTNAELTRVAVVVSYVGEAQLDWYTPHVLEGFGSVAEQRPLAVEVLGHRENDADAISKRLHMTQPDVLAVLSASPSMMWVIRDAQRLGIPVVTAGTPYRGLGLPVACEDNVQGMRSAVRHLHEAGHREIGLVIDRKVGQWVIERHAAFGETCRELGLGEEDGRVHWVPWLPDVVDIRRPTENLGGFLGRSGVTAVVCGGFYPTQLLGRLVRSGGCHVPADLSVVSFDQHHDAERWLGLKPTTVEIPLVEMGRRLAEMALQSSPNGKAIPAEEVVLPCSLRAGQSVSSPKTTTA